MGWGGTLLKSTPLPVYCGCNEIAGQDGKIGLPSTPPANLSTFALLNNLYSITSAIIAHSTALISDFGHWPLFCICTGDFDVRLRTIGDSRLWIRACATYGDKPAPGRSRGRASIPISSTHHLTWQIREGGRMLLLASCLLHRHRLPALSSPCARH